MKSLSTTAFTVAAAGLLCAWAVDRASATTSAVEGTAKGKVTFEGKKPEIKPLSIGAEAAKGCCPPGKEIDSKDQSMLIGAGDGIANVVVMIPVEGAELKPGEPLHIDQKECHFEPHVQVVPAGGKILFLNSDQVAHNVHTYAGKNDAFNKTIAPGGKEEQVLAKGEKFEVKCDIHPWMNSWVVVADTPHYAITKEDGSFEIKGLKPGTYKAELWHEKLGKSKADVVIKEDGSSDPIEVKMGEKKKK
jgi:plastocyanin